MVRQAKSETALQLKQKVRRTTITAMETVGELPLKVISR